MDYDNVQRAWLRGASYNRLPPSPQATIWWWVVVEEGRTKEVVAAANKLFLPVLETHERYFSDDILSIEANRRDLNRLINFVGESIFAIEYPPASKKESIFAIEYPPASKK